MTTTSYILYFKYYSTLITCNLHQRIILGNSIGNMIYGTEKRRTFDLIATSSAPVVHLINIVKYASQI